MSVPGCSLSSLDADLSAYVLDVKFLALICWLGLLLVTLSIISRVCWAFWLLLPTCSRFLPIFLLFLVSLPVLVGVPYILECEPSLAVMLCDDFTPLLGSSAVWFFSPYFGWAEILHRVRQDPVSCI